MSQTAQVQKPPGHGTLATGSIAIAGIITVTQTDLSVVTAQVVDAGAIMVALTSAAFSGTLQFEGCVADDSGYFAISLTPNPSGTPVSSVTAGGAVAAQWFGNIAGCTKFRVRCSAYTSGTVVVSIGVSIAENPAGGTVTVSGSVTVADGADATQGVTTGAAVVTDANGTVQQYLRGIVKLMIGGVATLLNVVGNVAAGVSDSGNPVKVGGKYNSSLPTLTTGQRGDMQLDAASIALINNAYKLDYVNDIVGVADASGNRQVAGDAQSRAMYVKSGYTYKHLAANATTVVQSGATILHSISINTKGITNTVTVYDNTAGSGTVVAVIDTTLGQDTLLFDVALAIGLTVVIAGGTAADITIAYV